MISRGRGCVHGLYGHIRIGADGIVRAGYRWDSGCTNGSYGLMVRTIVIRRCYRIIRFGKANQRWYRKGRVLTGQGTCK